MTPYINCFKIYIQRVIFTPITFVAEVCARLSPTRLQSRKVFQRPPMDKHLPNGCSAKFSDIVDLFNMEATVTLKKAHCLKPCALQPKCIEKTSVKLAVSVFCESTRDALKFYSSNEGRTSWAGAADFIT